MECFGTYDNLYPFTLLEDTINGAKGRIMGNRLATDHDRIDLLATDALESGTDGDADLLLQSIRIVRKQSPLTIHRNGY